MESIDKKIKMVVHSVKRRWIVSRLIKYSLYGLSGGLTLSIALVLTSLIIPITFIYVKIGIILAIGLSIGVGYNFLRLPSDLETAKVIDGSGLKERTITAIEMMASHNPYAEIVKKDAYEHLQNVESKKVMPLVPPVKSLVRMFAILFILVITLMIPSRHEAIVKEKENIQMAKKEIQKEVKKIKKEIKEDVYLSKDTKKDLEKVIAELNKDIMNADNEKELEKRAKANQELMKFKKNQAKEKRFNQMTEKLLANQKSEALGKALEKKDFELAKKEIDKLMEDVSTMSEEGYQELLSNLSEQLEGIDTEQLADALNQLASDMDLTNSQLGSSQYALSNSGSQSNGQTSSSNGNGSNNGNGNTGNGNNGNNGNSGNGSGSGSGNGSGNGAGNGGNGSGSGSGNGRGRGSANNDTDGQRVDGTTSDEQVNGQRGDKNSELQLMREGVSIAGEKVPYDRVISEYESKAYETMNSSDIPKGMQEVVKEYFSGLN